MLSIFKVPDSKKFYVLCNLLTSDENKTLKKYMQHSLFFSFLFQCVILNVNKKGGWGVIWKCTEKTIEKSHKF